MPSDTRIARIRDRAAEVFGDRERSRKWLERPNPALGQKSPAELLASESGALRVEQMLGRIEHGIAG